MTKEIYTPVDLAARWGCSLDVVYDMLRQHKIHGFKVGNQWRVSNEVVQQYEGGKTV